MSFKFSLNVLSTKVRAVYALRVKPAEYELMLSCKSLKELLKILKEKELYSDVFRNVQESYKMMNASDIERALNHKFSSVLGNIARYDKLLGGFLRTYIGSYVDSKFILDTFETVLKLKCGKKLLYEGRNWVVECKNPRLKALSFAKDFEEFFTIIRASDYKKLFEDISLKDEYFCIQSIVQKRLYEDLYNKLLSGICEIKNKKSRRELFSVFSCYLELRSFVFSIRAKRFGGQTSGFLPNFDYFKQKIISKLKNLSLESEYYELLNSSYLFSQIKRIKYHYLEQLPEKFLFLKCKKNIHFSLGPTVVVLSFINLLKIEIQNIIKIIEGVRCGLLRNKIREVLVV